MIKGLKEFGGLDIPQDLEAPETNQYLRDTCHKLGVQCNPPLTTTRLLDKVTSRTP